MIHLENSDALAQIGKALGQNDIDIVSMAGTSAFGVCTAILFTDNEKGTMKILRQLEIPFSTQYFSTAPLFFLFRFLSR